MIDHQIAIRRHIDIIHNFCHADTFIIRASNIIIK